MKIMDKLLRPSEEHPSPESERAIQKHVTEIAWAIIAVVTEEADKDKVDTLGLLAGLSNTFEGAMFGIRKTFGNSITYVMKRTDDNENPLGV